MSRATCNILDEFDVLFEDDPSSEVAWATETN